MRASLKESQGNYQPAEREISPSGRPSVSFIATTEKTHALSPGKQYMSIRGTQRWNVYHFEVSLRPSGQLYHTIIPVPLEDQESQRKQRLIFAIFDFSTPPRALDRANRQITKVTHI